MPIKLSEDPDDLAYARFLVDHNYKSAIIRQRRILLRARMAQSSGLSAFILRRIARAYLHWQRPEKAKAYIYKALREDPCSALCAFECASMMATVPGARIDALQICEAALRARQLGAFHIDSIVVFSMNYIELMSNLHSKLTIEESAEA